jgi:3-isopropylmalate/(R)-2-methylmalate dehydratase small subunit
MNGYIAMQALGLGLVCESMPFLGYRGAIGAGLRVLTDCQGATEECETGDELEVDFDRGMFINHTRGTRREYPPLADSLKEIIALGGNTGWLRQWWGRQQGDGAGRNLAGDGGGCD